MTDWNIQASYREPDPTAMPAAMGQIFTYWQSLLEANRFAPSWKQFDLLAIPPAAIPWCVIVDVNRYPLDFVYRFFGTARATMHGKDFTGKSVSAVTPQSFGEKGVAEYRRVMDTMAPVHIANSRNTDQRELVCYDTLRLPLSDDGSQVDHIFTFTTGGVNFAGIYEYAGTKPPLDLLRLGVANPKA